MYDLEAQIACRQSAVRISIHLQALRQGKIMAYDEMLDAYLSKDEMQKRVLKLRNEIKEEREKEKGFWKEITELKKKIREQEEQQTGGKDGK